MLNRPGRKTHSDRLGEDEAQKALHPQSPAGRSDQLQLAGPVPDGRRTYVKLQPTDVDRGRRTYRQTPSFRPVLLAENYVKSAAGSSSLVGDLPESESSVRSDPGNRDRAPRFLWSETLVESQTVPTLLPHQRPDVKAFGQSTPKVFTELH